MEQIVLDRLKNILANLIPSHSTLEEIKSIHKIDDLGLDSIQILKFLLKVEEEFKFKIDDDDLDIELIRDLDKLADYIVKHGNVQKYPQDE